MTIDAMTTMIEKLDEKEVGIGASREAIQSAKQLLDVELPNDYDAFLQKFGWARLNHDEFYGIGSSVPNHLHLVSNTERERTIFRPFLPNHLIPVMPDGAGNHFCLDTSQIANGRCPVVFWDHDAGENQTPSFVCQSFSEWMVEHILEQM